MVPELPKRLFTGEEVLRITGATEGALRSWMLYGQLTPAGGYHVVEHSLARIEEILFTAREIAAALEWGEAVVADLWAMSGEARPDTIPNVGGQQDETPEMCVARMRNEGADNAKILRFLRSELMRRGLPYGDEACGLLLFSKENITKAAAKQKSVRLRQQHGID